MRIEFRRTEPVLGARVRERIERRIRFTLGRFADRIRRINVWMQDAHGPRGGVDQRCWLEVELHPRGRIHAEAFGIDELMAATSASRRVARRVRDELTRQRSMQRRGSIRVAVTAEEGS